MRIREPRANWLVFLWIWALLFGGIPLVVLFVGVSAGDAPPVPLLLLFVVIAAGVMAVTTRWSLRAGFHLEPDGIHGAHDAERTVVPWGEVDRIEWRWSPETSGVTVNNRPLPDGYALHAVLRDGRAVRLMQRVAATYGQQQACNEQMARAQLAGALPCAFDATIPTHDGGLWSGTPPARSHRTWGSADLPPADPATAPGGADDGPVWPTG